MHSYLFFLGQTTDLCFAELCAVASRLDLSRPQLLDKNLALLHTDESIDAQAVQELLGGTVKIGQIIETLSMQEREQIEEKLLEYLRQHKPKRFVIAELGRDHLPPIQPEDFKHTLAKEGIKISYKDAPRSGANAALLKSSKATELFVIQSERGIELVVTLAHQDVDIWSLRDVGKPHRDRKRGMLQPKIAHMMLNLAIGDLDPKSQVVLDPFCGTGTILIEATMLDVPVVLASDSSDKAVEQTRGNLDWWHGQLEENFESEVVISPAEKITGQTFSHQPTVIVTEPFLGKLTPKPEEIPGIIRGLEKMYKGMLRSFSNLLPEGGRVAILLPAYQLGKKTVTVEKTLEDAQRFGFKLQAGPYRAGRPDAVTLRSVYVFEKGL